MHSHLGNLDKQKNVFIPWEDKLRVVLIEAHFEMVMIFNQTLEGKLGLNVKASTFPFNVEKKWAFYKE